MKLYDYPGSCSIGIHALLEEIGVPYDIEVINLSARAQLSDEFKTVNPKGKVPALLRDDGTVLTEFPAIAFWLAKKFPDAGLMGNSVEDETRALELLDYIVGSVHMRGLTLVLMPMKFHSEKACQDSLRRFGQSEVNKGLVTLGDTLGKNHYLLGDFTIADAALFYVLRMTREYGFELPGNLEVYFTRLSDRPAFATALARMKKLR